MQLTPHPSAVAVLPGGSRRPAAAGATSRLRRLGAVRRSTSLQGSAQRHPVRALCALGVFVATILAAAGCGSHQMPSQDQLASFNQAGPITPVLDVDSLVRAKSSSGVYRVIAGDVLELQIPVVTIAGVADSAGKVESHLCRVADTGRIYLPIVGEIDAAGKTLAEIEAGVVAAYYPKYATKRPNVVAQVKDYRTRNVSIVGAVKEPGVYALHHDEMSLVVLLMKAKGITQEGASTIRVRRPGAAGPAEPVALPVKGLNVPFADIALSEGDVVEVERMNPEVFTVVGLVQRGGTFPYLPGTQYTLMQALAFAGGVDPVTCPRYATVYRQDKDGKVVSAAFELQGSALTGPSNVAIKPGDVIALEHDAGTRTRLILAQMLRFGFGVNAGYTLNPTSD
jgi:protein involved in polysaccharide export with SLBB domain